MRKRIGLTIGVTLGVLVVLLLGRAALSQESDLPPGGESLPGSSAHQSSEPIAGSKESAGPAGSAAPSAVEEAEAAPAQTYTYLRVLGSALRPRDSDVEWQSSGSGGCVYAVSGDDQTVWNTPIYLPQGATVRQLRMYWNDTNASVDCWGFFTVYNYQGALVDEWWVPSEGSAGFNHANTDLFNHTIDYNLYSYVVNWRPRELGEDMQLCGFRIMYEPPPGAVFLPVIHRND